MCGIVGFTGSQAAAPLLLDGLRKLEYRGYDSAGLAVRQGDGTPSVRIGRENDAAELAGVSVVASRYGANCQGADELALTLLDVLDYMDEVPVVEKYLVDGVETDRFPMGTQLDNAQPVVRTLPGWHCDISGCRRWEELPEAAQNYVCLLYTSPSPRDA